MEPEVKKMTHQNRLVIGALGALGVVYGDIGTSPLYALRECFLGHNRPTLVPENIIGVLSLILWSLIIVVTGKYIFYILRFDNRGEGGILALMALAAQKADIKKRSHLFMVISMGIFGSALLYGDGIITPAITVLGAVEGLKVGTPIFSPYVITLSVAILVVLFLVQRIGSGKIGIVFGPIMLLWFSVIGSLGLHQIGQEPRVLEAINPFAALLFFVENKWIGFTVLGGVLLVITGAEALYADMGHFGKKPIAVAWLFVVLPALLFNYFGQGALLLSRPEAIENPFFFLAPSWAVVPLVILSTAAAIIASQALISGVFSVTRQGIQLGFFPRLSIIHTSSEEIGQVYVPFINWLLLFLTIWVVYSFRSSENLAGAYGLAVSTMMVMTTILAAITSRRIWKWSETHVFLISGSLLLIDIAFFSATSLKFIEGGWLPILVAVLIFTIMSTWKRGREILALRLSEKSIPLDKFLDDVAHNRIARIPGTGIFMTGDPTGTPAALIHNLKHNKVLHDRVVFMTVRTEEVPYVSLEGRAEIKEIGPKIFRVLIHYGFQETPNIKKILKFCEAKGLSVSMDDATFFVGRETLVASRAPGMAIWREKLFIFMARNAQGATSFFRIPSNKVIEVGLQVDL
jgi:KUP system potassium uptake protein